MLGIYTSPAAFKNHTNSCSTNKLDLWDSFRLLKESREAQANLAQATVTVASKTGTSELVDDNILPDGPTPAMEEYIDAHIEPPPPAKRHRKAAKVFTDGKFVPLDDAEEQPDHDLLPTPLIALPVLADPYYVQQAAPAPNAVYDTPANVFGLFCRYTLHSSSNNAHSTSERHDPDSLMDLTKWFWNRGAQKSKESFRDLLKILGSEDFSTIDDDDAGWHESSIVISIPFHRNTDNPGVRNYTINGFYHRTLTSVICEKLTLKREDATNFHLEPYELLWQKSRNQQPIPLYAEMYMSQAFLSAHQKLQEAPPEPGCTLPRVVVALMLWSDATHLTQFGNAKITPLYMYFGNKSKYRRSKPSCRLAEHVAFFQQLPDSFNDFADRWTGSKKVSSELIAHCKRELSHEQWRILLDNEFLEAYEHGIVLDWIGDGKRRRFYPRFMTYSADYPEKVLMSTIRQLGGCPCPRCKMPKKKLHLVGTDEDRGFRVQSERRDNNDRRQKITRARQSIYGPLNLAVDSAAVERELKPESLVPTLNAFSDRLLKFGLNYPSMFVVDLLHEIELGVFKAFIVHLLRILESVDENLVHELDRRFRAVPTFGRDTIRRFTTNASELKKMAAHNYEDLLQCIIPVFDGLLSDEGPSFLNARILCILFQLVHWHGLAKLRLHSEATLGLLDQQTTVLGECLREFQMEICPLFATRELRREAVAQERRAATKGSASGTSRKSKTKAKASSGQAVNAEQDMPRHHPSEPQGSTQPEVAQEVHDAGVPTTTSASTPNLTTQTAAAETVPQEKGKKPSARKDKNFNLNTYKVHSLGDYVSAIRTFGTMDSYSTETGELEHRVPKSNYKRTSKKVFQRQLARMERRQTRLHRMMQATSGTSVAFEDMSANDASMTNPAERYHIGASEHNKQDICIFVRDNTNNPAISVCLQDFYSKLKVHLLPRLKAHLKIPTDSNTSADLRPHDEERLFYKNDAIYQHNVLRINYTTYDIRRLQDVVNPCTDHRDIMLLRQPMIPGKHEYKYGRIIGIYHVNAIYHGPLQQDLNKSHRIDFVWVRWFDLVDGYDRPVSEGWSGEFLGLDQLTFPSIGSETAFGFLDPADILRSCHIAPRFGSMQRHSDGIGLSGIAQDKYDWSSYYVNRFVDRDMIMRFHWGMGVGHASYMHLISSLPRAHPANRRGSHDGVTTATEVTSRVAHLDVQAATSTPLAHQHEKAAIEDDNLDVNSDSESSDLDYSSESDPLEETNSMDEDYDDMYGDGDDID
ncbi:hypothetical protein DXG01_000659 [Tephrocybe rancida]|nr:hypothetical protein DXG01_000659 [Tephrocybe rancida]